MIFDSILNRAPVPPVRLNPDVPPELERVINKCLEKDRSLRYQHASDIRTDLRRLKRDTDSGLLITSAKPGATPDIPTRWKREAYLAAHQGAEAAAEFQKILDHRGIVVSDPIGALAHLQRGRAFMLSGDKTRAKTAYQDFLALWKDADPDIPILEQAKAEYAKLQ